MIRAPGGRRNRPPRALSPMRYLLGMPERAVRPAVGD
jgi:hypothetical protein